jgi:predicted membrane protein
MAIDLGDDDFGFGNRRKRNRLTRSAGAQLAIAVALIAFGILLFLDNVGILALERLYDYWPAIPILLGVARLTYRPTVFSALWACFFIIVGTGFLLVNLDVLRIRNGAAWPIALLCITAGFAALVKTVDKRAIAERRRQSPGFIPWSSTDILNETVVMGSLKRRVESANFQGGELHNLMGNLELDLRSAQLPPGAKSVTIEVECVLGVTNIRVPESWKVCIRAQGVLGNVEDKTLPTRDEKGDSAPTLVIAGSSIMGNVELQN